MNILFVYPRVGAHSMNFYNCLDLVGARFSHIPLPPLTLAALTPDDVAVSLIDENVEDLPETTDADVIAISAMLAQRERALELAAQFRALGKFVVVGGAYTRSCPEEAAEAFDAVFDGEAELTWPQFIRDYQAGTPQRLYRQQDYIDMSRSPIPRFDLLKQGVYAGASVQATRGCSYQCAFCDVPVTLGSMPRSKPIPQVVEEVRRLSDMGFDSIFFVDDSFSANKVYAKDLLRALIAARPMLRTRMYFYTQDTIMVGGDAELLALYRDAGFVRIFVGLETGDRSQLLALNKKHNTSIDLGQAIRRIQAHGITVWAGMMFGLEQCREEDFARQMSFIREHSLIPVQMGLLQALPDTPLYQQMEAKGRIRPLSSVVGSAAMGQSHPGPGSNIVQPEMDDETLRSVYAGFLRNVVSPQVFVRLLSDIGNKVSRRTVCTWPTVNWALIKTAGRLIRYYLFRANGEERRLFLRIVGLTLMGRMGNVDDVIFHLIAYKHIRQFYLSLADNLAS